MTCARYPSAASRSPGMRDIFRPYAGLGYALSLIGSAVARLIRRTARRRPAEPDRGQSSKPVFDIRDGGCTVAGAQSRHIRAGVVHSVEQPVPDHEADHLDWAGIRYNFGSSIDDQ